MKRLLHACIYSSVTICGLLLSFSAVSRSQNITKLDASIQQPNSSNPSANTNPNPPIGGRSTQGSINGNTYTNDFFQFSFPVPEGWKLLGKDVEPRQDSGGAVLLLVGSADRQTRGARWISIGAIKIPSGEGNLTAEAYLKTEAYIVSHGNSMDASKDAIQILTKGVPTEISLGGRRMARLEFTGSINNNPIRAAHLAMISRGYIMIIMLSDPDGVPGIEAAQAINSLHFLGKTN